MTAGRRWRSVAACSRAGGVDRLGTVLQAGGYGDRYGGWRMSYGEDLFTPRDDLASRRQFETALRGYDKRQVDQHLAEMDNELLAVIADRDRALNQVQQLATQLEHAQAELTELRQRPPQIERASFRDLGPTVDQILALAEKQAKEITDQAAQRAAELQAEAEKTLADAQQQAEWLRADSEAAREQAEAEAKRISEQAAQHAQR